MIPQFTHLTTSRNSADQAAYTTASISPSAGRLLVVFVHSIVGSGTANTPTLSGGGISTLTERVVSGTLRKMSVFTGLTGASPTSEAITIDFAAQAQLGCEWIANSTGSNQTSYSVTFGSAWDDDDNRALAGFAQGDSAASFTAGTNFTMLGQVAGSGPSSGLGTQYGRDSDLVVDMTSAAEKFWRAIALEIAGAADAPGPNPNIVLRRIARRGLNRGIN
jgi:hypothetical protein